MTKRQLCKKCKVILCQPISILHHGGICCYCSDRYKRRADTLKLKVLLYRERTKQFKIKPVEQILEEVGFYLDGEQK